MLCRIEISAAAIRHNYRTLQKLVAPSIMVPVIKANAYGHGLGEVYQALEAERPPWVAVNYLSEAAELRHRNYQGRILVVGPAVSRELGEATKLGAEIVVGNDSVLAGWLAIEPKPRIHIKFDTGMSRQGFLPECAGELVSKLVPHAGLVVGVCTHFANVEDVTDQAYADRQLQLFQNAAQVLRQGGLSLIEHAASSASSLILAPSRLHLSRIGISLYGVWPSPVTRVSFLQLQSNILELRPALSWLTEVTTVKDVRSGDYIGYGCTYRAIRDMRVAVLPVGYYEGYPRIAGEHPAYVLLHGKRAPLVGRICMNMMMVDVTHINAVNIGDTVTLIGRDQDEYLSAHEVAHWAQTIHYELLTRLNPEIPRRLVGI